MKKGWNYCDGTCGYVAEYNTEAACRRDHKRHCSGTMCFLEMTEDEYTKYKPLIDKMGVLEFAKSLPPNRPLTNPGYTDLIAMWDKEMGL